MLKLSASLQPIYDFEIRRGNRVGRIDSPAGSRCPLAVIFAIPLYIKGFLNTSGLPAGVQLWQNNDRHYDLEAGYLCEQTRQAIAGPIAAP